jgi:hypothetical protein
MAPRNRHPSVREDARTPHTGPDEDPDERWKTSPSTETTADEGENARRAAARKHAENSPRKPAGKPPRH